MTIRHEPIRTLILLLAAFCLLGSYSTPLHGQTLMQGSLGDSTETKMSLFILDLSPGRSAPVHSHDGAVFAYVLEGEIENQVDPDPPKMLHAGDFFHERPKQVHRVFRNLSKTASAKVLVLQNTTTLPPGVKALLQETLTDPTRREVTLRKITTTPGAPPTNAHQHPGQVFAYLLKGEVESQVDPGQAKVYHAGDVFYEPAMHAHRLYRNLSKTETAELLVFFLHKKDEPLTSSVNQ